MDSKILGSAFLYAFEAAFTITTYSLLRLLIYPFLKVLDLPLLPTTGGTSTTAQRPSKAL